MIKNKLGQSTVEYILLFAVVALLTLSAINSGPFKNFFGENASFFAQMRKRMEYNYRYGSDGMADNFQSYSDNHDLYAEPSGARSHFFSPQGP